MYIHDVEVKSIYLIIPTDFFVFHTLEILKTFEIRSFFYEKWLLSHVLWIPKSYSLEKRKEVIKNATHCLLCCIFLCTYYIGITHDNLRLFSKKF